MELDQFFHNLVYIFGPGERVSVPTHGFWVDRFLNPITT